MSAGSRLRGAASRRACRTVRRRSGCEASCLRGCAETATRSSSRASARRARVADRIVARRVLRDRSLRRLADRAGAPVGRAARHGEGAAAARMAGEGAGEMARRGCMTMARHAAGQRARDVLRVTMTRVFAAAACVWTSSEHRRAAVVPPGRRCRVAVSSKSRGRRAFVDSPSGSIGIRELVLSREPFDAYTASLRRRPITMPTTGAPRCAAAMRGASRTQPRRPAWRTCPGGRRHDVRSTRGAHCAAHGSITTKPPRRLHAMPGHTGTVFWRETWKEVRQASEPA